MEATRQIYWNVGHGVLIPMYIFAFGAIFSIFYNFKKRSVFYRQGKNLNRTDNFVQRVLFALKSVFGQTKVMNTRVGLFHGIFFWGFILLVIGTTLVFIQADFLDPLFGIIFLKGNFYRLFSVVLDIAGLLTIIMMGGLFVRRFILKPDGVETKVDDYIMQFLLFSIIFTGFFVEALRMAATEINQNLELAKWSPVGFFLGNLFVNMPYETLLISHKTLWWIHFFLVISFFVSIPFIKFRHIITTSANYLFSDLRRKGSIDTIDMENDEAESFGASSIKDLTWKDIFDTDACTKCKRCQDRCPAYNTGKPLSPMKLIADIGEVAFDNPDENLIEKVSKDVLWSCTTCRACQEICPANIEHVNKILEMRRNLVLMEGEFPGDEVMKAMENMEVNGNPMGMGFASRGDFAKELPVKILYQDSNVDIMYFVGCYASFDKRNQKIAKNFIEICNTAGLSVGILGKEEKCCGEPARKLGNEYLYQSLAQENIEKIKKYGIKKVVSTCPHCFNTLSRDYKDLGIDVEVEHYTTFLYNLLNEGKITLQQSDDRLNVTYHDSCYIGRYMDIYRQPREILAKAGANISEMDKNGAESFCCGAGGGRIIVEEKLGDKISVKRVNMAKDTGSGTLVSNCPFCLTMFEDGIKMAGLEGKLKAMDLSEILIERLKK